MLEVKLLGEPAVDIDGSALTVDTRKAVAILAYLAVEGSASRDTLMSLFWPDAAPDRARATLRRTLSALRSGLGGEYLVSDRNRVALEGAVRVDLVEVQREIEATHDHDHDPGDVCSACIPHLQRATELHRGDFLQGFNLGDAVLFEDWERTVAEQVRMRIGVVFKRLGYALAGVGDYGAAIRAVARWVDQDPLHEPAHRLLMLLHAWSGDRPGAVEAYRSFVGVLDRELGVSPLEETTELYEAILDEDLPPAPGARHRVRSAKPPGPVARGVMLDRADELDELLLAGAQPTGSSVSITGDAWMGKTRLIEEFAAASRAGGSEVLVATAAPTEQMLPFGVFTQVIDRLLAMAGAGSGPPDWARVELARLNPRVGHGLPQPGDRFGEVRLLEAIRALVTEAAEGRRLVLVIDDIQWADRPSLSALVYLSRRLGGTSVLLMVAGRSGEQLDPAAIELIEGADRKVVLRPLDAAALDGHVDPDRAAEIAAATGGVPLLMLEAADGDRDRASAGVLRYISARVKDVSDLARQLLAAISVLAGVAGTGILREVSGRSEEEVVEGVEELIAAGLITELRDTDELRFTLDSLESQIYESTSLVRRRLLHRRAAHALESVPWARSDLRVARAVAAQFRGAGDPVAASWYRLAGDLARDVYAHDEARVCYETSIALGADLDGSLHLALGEVAMARGDYQAARAELGVAAAHATDAIRAIVEQRLGEVMRTLGRFDLALESYEMALESHPRPSEVYAERALLHHRIGARTEAVSDASRSLDLSRSSRDASQLARSLNVAALVSDDEASALEFLDEALDLAGDDELARMSTLNVRAGLLSARADTEAAVDAITEAIGIAERTGHLHREAALRNHLADLHHQAGRDAEAERALREAVSIFADLDAGEWEPELWLLRQW